MDLSDNEELSEDINELEGWTKQEKFNLLQAIKENGSQYIQLISNFIPTKSEEEIKMAISYYKKKALEHPTTWIQKNIRRANNLPVIPLSVWAKNIIDTHSFESLGTETAAALRLIAQYEDRPASVCTANIDFKKAYTILADALEGKTIPHDHYILPVFEKCILETALTSKAYMKSSAYKQVIQSINNNTQEVNLFKVPDDDNELIALRHLACQISYNPLNIPEKYLKSSVYS
ncbi:uncharacterized protein LOC133319007 [Danaus plexippus]|uniref:uncharacterized protein LOC133319007 n=1 Tax=Danaus plexippus TaxID=13037 RepID=UPI002AAFC08C|nr:uncharacterized protein LOC133319007 [Danaus plexippus]